MEEVKLGGAWKVAADRYASLERSTSLLQQELSSLREVLSRSESEKQSLQECVSKTRSQLARVALQAKSTSDSLRSSEKSRSIAESLAASLQQEHAVLIQERDTLRSNFLEKDRQLQEEREKVRELNGQLRVALEESANMQAQYDIVEERAERWEEKAKEEKGKKEKLAKAKEQKERYICILVKERDRALQQLVETKAQLSSSRLGRRPHAKENVENEEPNKVVAKVTVEETAKLASFSAPNRMKARLGEEIARRKQAEAQLEKLKAENEALRTRYRNLRKL